MSQINILGWQEMAEYDVPAMLEYVLKVTGQAHLHYVGYSPGIGIIICVCFIWLKLLKPVPLFTDRVMK